MDSRADVEIKRSLLCDWYLHALRRHGRMLASEHVRHTVRAGGRPYRVTSEQLLNALEATYRELYVAVARHADCASDESGRPSQIAVAGLAQRRFRSRLVDEIRRGQRTPEVIDPARIFSASDDAHGALLPATTDDSLDRLDGATFHELGQESRMTREAVIRSAAGFTAPEIASQLGITAAAVRQRTSRFGRRVRALEKVA